MAVVTGANGGTGYHVARLLAASGATVIMACRHYGRMAAAASAIEAVRPNVTIRRVRMDLGNLGSVRDAASQILDDHGRLDILVNNAGLMGAPRWDTFDGVEMHFGVNHLGHFAFTGLLLPALLASPDARIVTVSSMAHHVARLDPADWPSPRVYNPYRAYAASKLANLLFSYELHRRLAAVGVPGRSIACHPGWSDTQLLASARRYGGRSAVILGLRMLASVVAQPAWEGARPMLAAATRDVPSGSYLGPSRWWHTRGPAGADRSSDASHDEEAARRLWDISTELTGVDLSTALMTAVPGTGSAPGAGEDRRVR
ncbi:NAD(P)-dependent dehydrogenase, short-chain alcohol dehydrogenase family [Micromonospora nigra]|uniref:NAD(P)-dependent dehydrogenase, short-chain alcohol dehydrogenase family n=1 Tax=Micromonospora nigra TaxID=145857 RepID=A0A1C6R7Z2_9ACTN|nr:NAD(P)-dependent dehydrogenase, short-chain alcohol dehydrogenase family [Micromonospora nigra]